MPSTTAHCQLDGTSNTLLVIQDHKTTHLHWCGRKLREDTVLTQLLAQDDTTLAYGNMDAAKRGRLTLSGWLIGCPREAHQ